MPILMYGGPSPRIRALANQDRLNFRNVAASFGFNKTSETLIAVVIAELLVIEPAIGRAFFEWLREREHTNLFRYS